MSSFDNETERKVREILRYICIDFDPIDEIEYQLDEYMNEIHPYLIDLGFLRELYSITEDDDLLYKDMIWNIKDKIEEYFKKRGDAL